MHLSKVSHKILHITPHLGGGIGTVLLNWVQYDEKNQHTIITLDFVNEYAKTVCAQGDIELHAQIEASHICELIPNFDIIVIHFWNHPLLYDFLIRNTLPPSRLIIWSHISGFEPPNVITPKILHYPDIFIYTTPISQSIAPNKVILSTGNITPFIELSPQQHDDFTVGYIGTVDYVKMHPQYVTTLAQTKANKFIIVGGEKHKEIAKTCHDPRFIFTGKTYDIRQYLQQMDVFTYLLNPTHFGTAEQSLQEAMAAGIVPVVLNNACESSLIKHGKTGLIAQSLDEYILYINMLQHDITLRNKLSKQAKNYAKQHFSLERLCKQWQDIYIKIMPKAKQVKSWSMQDDINSLSIFFESIGEHAKLFTHIPFEQRQKILKQAQWQCSSKGSPRQYYDFLGGEALAKIITDL